MISPREPSLKLHRRPQLQLQSPGRKTQFSKQWAQDTITLSFRHFADLCAGLPNWRLKLPSRNWLIFLSITGSIAAAITYDRREKKAAQRKWCDLVAHIAQEPLPVNQMRRKLSIFLSAPPGDGIRPSREYFKQYVKPILVAAAVDYDVIEGRKEGDVRYGTAEQIRRYRRRRGERGNSEAAEEPDLEQALERLREKVGIRPEPGIKGDLVIGRHTWKEYIRGLHEGWLGPLEEPTPSASDSSPTHPQADPPSSILESEGASLDAAPTEDGPPKDVEEEKNEKKPPSPPYAYLPTAAYSTSPISQTIPQTLEPSAPIPHLHLLGFLKTPIRVYNYLNQRKLADDIGRQTAAIVLAAHRPYHQSEAFASPSSSDSNFDSVPVATRAPESHAERYTVIQTSQNWEQQSVLVEEEPTWHKSVRKPRKDDLERVWLDDIVIDPRIAERMCRFVLDPEEEARARRIGQGTENGRAVPVEDLENAKTIIDPN
jgi:import inner membrane translocase subunit TIM54